MEITWFGHTCFRITERGMATVVTDPFDSKFAGYKPLKLKADILTTSNESPGHNFSQAVKGYSHFLNGPGEYEIGGVFITGVRINGQPNSKKDSSNTMFVFDYGKAAVAHLGALKQVPNQTEIEALGNVHIALVPVGGGESLTAAKAVEVVSLLEPSIVIPMHFATPAASIKLTKVDKFLKEMGAGEVENESSLKITRSLSAGDTRVVVLNHQG
jgi:L-ascorbate metabolism protein UlaG (beta-lactamase superfamily)